TPQTLVFAARRLRPCPRKASVCNGFEYKHLTYCLKKFVKGNLNNSLNQESVVNKNLTKRGIPELTKKYAHKWLTQT
ncbi:hypothetical protein KS419_10595, partial [Bacillus tamaricis]